MKGRSLRERTSQDRIAAARELDHLNRQSATRARRPGARTLVVLLLLVASQLVLWPTLEWLQRPIADRPLSISPAGSLETDARIHVQQRYRLSLDLPNKDAQGRAMNREALGGRQYPRVDGASIPLEWALADSRSGQVVAGGTVDTRNASQWGGGVATRHIAFVDVPPGRYRLSVRVLRDVIELQGITGRLRLGLPGGKISAGWTSTLLFWGPIASVLLVWPAIGVLIIVFLWKRSGPWRRE